MKNTFKHILLLGLGVWLCVSCKKKSDDTTPATSSTTNPVGSAKVQLNDGSSKNGFMTTVVGDTAYYSHCLYLDRNSESYEIHGFLNGINTSTEYVVVIQDSVFRTGTYPIGSDPYSGNSVSFYYKYQLTNGGSQKSYYYNSLTGGTIEITKVTADSIYGTASGKLRQNLSAPSIDFTTSFRVARSVGSASIKIDGVPMVFSPYYYSFGPGIEMTGYIGAPRPYMYLYVKDYSLGTGTNNFDLSISAADGTEYRLIDGNSYTMNYTFDALKGFSVSFQAKMLNYTSNDTSNVTGSVDVSF